MLGLIRGRLYYNLLNWYRVLALLPGFAMNRRFMEQMMGVREGLPEALAARSRPASAGARLVDGAVPRAHAGGPGRESPHARPPRGRRSTARLDAALAPPVPPLADRRPDELAAHYRELRGSCCCAGTRRSSTTSSR